MTTHIIILSVLINFYESYMPNSIKQTFRFGKVSFKGVRSQLISMLEVPKSYFQHFYIYAALLMLWMFGVSIAVYLFHVQVPRSFTDFLDKIGGINRIARVSTLHVLLAELLLTLQCVKRFYDSNFVSVFSKSKMNISHYAAGFIHYTGCAVAIILEAPEFAVNLSISRIHNLPGLGDLFATVIFLLACYGQLQVTIILANLRKNIKGKVISEKHLLPQGGLFNYLSSPHMSCEILMYTCLTYILRGNSTWLFVYAWVFTNQIEVIMLNHWWYQNTFPNFPKNRKALIPFVY